MKCTGHGDYGGARVVLVGLDYVPLVREVDPVLFPESEELATVTDACLAIASCLCL